MESLDVPNGKIARIVPDSVIETNKNTPSVDSINTNTDTVAINCATSPIQSPRSHSNRNTITKSKVVKLNRKTLGLNLNNSQQVIICVSGLMAIVAIIVTFFLYCR